MAASRGFRNNNPGNIRYITNAIGLPPAPFVGEVRPPDGTYRRFVNMPFGYRALFMLLESAYFGEGFNTLASIFNKYAPASDSNDPAGYAQVAKRYLGVDSVDLELDPTKDVLMGLARAITKEENGVEASDSVLENGYQLFMTPNPPVPDTSTGTVVTSSPDEPYQGTPVQKFFRRNKKQIPWMIGGTVLVLGIAAEEIWRHRRNKRRLTNVRTI